MGWFERASWAATERLDAAGRRRRIRTLDRGGTTTTVDADPREVVQFASNDYLGLATHPRVADAAAAAAQKVGAGSGASRLVVGGREVHDELERELAAWKAPARTPDPAALLFPTGYAANIGVLGSVATAGGRDDTLVFSDELNHASIIDGARLARVPVEVFGHLDLDDLERRLRTRSRPHAVVVSDLVFSMDGDVADAAALSELCAAHDALLVLDVAHDVFGATDGLAPGAEILVVGTLSKALGSLGGFVAGPRHAVDLVLNTARSFIFTTAPAPPSTAAALEATRIVRSEEGAALLGALRRNVDLLAPGHPSPIIPVVLGPEERAMQVSAALLEEGLLVPAIRPPTVAPGTSRLRVAVSAAHTPDDLGRLRDSLDRLGVALDPPALLGA